MNIFSYRDRLIADYAEYVRSFMTIADGRIGEHVSAALASGLLWPEPLIQLNPSFEPGGSIDSLVDARILHDECRRVFRIKAGPEDSGNPLRLHLHQEQAIRVAASGSSYVLTTGTGSGKSLSYIVPIVDHVLRRGTGKGIQAIVVYPMNALANSQHRELEKFLCHGYPSGKPPVTFARYTGQEKPEERDRVLASPPDILLTNYVMLELILTRPFEKRLIKAAKGLSFFVLDELHTYRGRQGSDVSMLVRRVRQQLDTGALRCVGTSATLASSGSWEQQRRAVAKAASALFGTPVPAENVIGETLRRLCPEASVGDGAYVEKLKHRVLSDIMPPASYAEFIQDPLSAWLETIFGLSLDPQDGRLRRAVPRKISGEDGAASALATLTGLPLDVCVRAIQRGLLAGYECEPNPQTGFRPFAFRLHQFISRGDTVYASLEAADDRYITTSGQQFVPGDRNKYLYPLVFCRECGQEYYTVRVKKDAPKTSFPPFDPSTRRPDADVETGYLYSSARNPWPETEAGMIERLPDDWLEDRNGRFVIRKARRESLPQPLHIGPNGELSPDGTLCHLLPGPFRFCLSCGVAYNFRQRSDFPKISTLGTEGRSTATTVLSLHAIREMERADLGAKARKLLSFSDNRQDASLQAGHFNDFIEVGVLRAALYKAAMEAGPEGLTHENLTAKVFAALSLPKSAYAADPDVRFQAEQDTTRALRDVLGYRIYLDLRRGWRIVSPNLEQCGLLRIDYLSLEDLCGAQDVWAACHAALATATPDNRKRILRALLDFIRRELAIKVDYLDAQYQETLRQRSSQRLQAPWAIDENERLQSAGVLYARSRNTEDSGGDVFLSPRGGFGQFLRRPGTFDDYSSPISTEECLQLSAQMLDALKQAGIVEVVRPGSGPEDPPGYQLVAASIVWVAGDGKQSLHDPIRVPNPPADGGRTNEFFVRFYRSVALEAKHLEAREHTAQVQNEAREDREKRFRDGRLPILYCSPTMELGIDISELNVVHMRNIPPTPANYAQRSGRAGRSGQPALVLSYCSTGNSHDQYFFRRPSLMVAGRVAPPRLDLANEELIRAHVQAIWLSETDLWLGESLKDILDLNGTSPSLALIDRVREAISDTSAVSRAKARALPILEGIRDLLAGGGWYSDSWLDEVFNQISQTFDTACDRWRGLYRAALNQAKAQTDIIHDATRTQEERRQAERLRREAESQMALLVSGENRIQSDFYSYRYFASEGFLPGYNFPRLPLSAYIPGRRSAKGEDEYLTRPRFLAISEFGPRSIVYHEGSKYIINRVILPVSDQDLVTSRVKKCSACGYFHPVAKGEGPDVCERPTCGRPLDQQLTQLFRMESVVTKRREKINSDEEERMRQGYELQTGVRFAQRDGHLACQTALASGDGIKLKLTYGHAATLWRINLGWSRRARREELGFHLDMERGYWASNKAVEEAEDDPLSPRMIRVIPYVEDRKNCLMIEPDGHLEKAVMVSLMAALKHAIQVVYQLEENELAAEPLPDSDNQNLLLFYEAAEGGAGVLRRLASESDALPEVAREALRLCHFDPDTGEDKRRAEQAKEDCEAACYDCLMSYGNQRAHDLLDRQLCKDLLLGLARAKVDVSATGASRGDHLEFLLTQCDSKLEEKWLHLLEANSLRLPSAAQRFIKSASTRADFYYEDCRAVIYIDGPDHDYPEIKATDETISRALRDDGGFTVIRFHHAADWNAILAEWPNVFGRRA